ncbi:MAG: DUF3256 family protein [Bacteroidaceae bacterium]
MKRIVAILSLLVFGWSLSVASDLKTLFIEMPDSLLPTLTRSERMDFFDYLESNMRARVRNKLGGESEMTLLEENRLTVQTSSAGIFDMVLFPKRDGSNLICIIRTVTARYQDSHISFYTDKWVPVESAKLIDMPVFEDYLTKEALKNDSLPEFKKMSMLRLQSISPVDGGLEFRYTSLDYIGLDADRFRGWIKSEPLRYTWNGRKFK